MPGPRRAWLVTIAALVAVATFAETAFAQVLPNTAANRRRGVVGCVQSGGGISCPGAPGGGGRSGYGYSGPSGADMMMGLMGMALDVMAQMEQAEQQQRMAYGQSLNQQGIRHYEGGNYQDSVNAFRQALSYLPGDSSVQGNLREAERLLAVEREKAEQENRRKMDEARSRIGVMLGQLQADFDGRAGGVSAIPNDGMDFAGPAGTSFFGTGGGTPTRIATAPSGGGKGGGDGLDFIGVGDSRFSKGGKGSAPPDLRPAPGAKDLGKDPGAEGGLDFLPAGQPVAKAPPSPTMQPPAAATTKPALKAVATAATAAATPRKPANTLVREAVEAGGGDWERARSRLADMARRNPDNAEARTALRQFEQLYADMRRAVHGANDGAPGPGGGNRPPLAPPRLVLDGDGPSAYEANRLANEAFYDAANGDLDRARRRLERARTLVPGDKALGEALAEIDFAQMARTKRAGERAGPAWAPPEGQAQAQSEASLGRWALESGRYDVAADAYAQAFVRDPSRRTQYDSSYTAARIGGILHSGRAPNPSVLAREGPVFDPPTGDGPSLLPQR